MKNYIDAEKAVLKFGYDGYWAVAFKNGKYETCDGGHDGVKGVQEAVKITTGIFGDEGYNWEMAEVKDGAVTFSEIPSGNPKVDEESIRVCNALVNRRWDEI